MHVCLSQSLTDVRHHNTKHMRWMHIHKTGLDDIMWRIKWGFSSGLSSIDEVLQGWYMFFCRPISWYQFGSHYPSPLWSCPIVENPAVLEQGQSIYIGAWDWKHNNDYFHYSIPNVTKRESRISPLKDLWQFASLQSSRCLPPQGVICNLAVHHIRHIPLLMKRSLVSCLLDGPWKTVQRSYDSLFVYLFALYSI